MKSIIITQPEEKWTISFKEMVGSFVYVLLYFLLIVPLTMQYEKFGLLIGAFTLAVVYFAIGWFYKPHASVHLIPIISFIKVIQNSNFKCFFYRITGQVAGALVAAFLYYLVSGGKINNYNLMVHPLNPFLTGLFIGIIAICIYFLYAYFLHNQKGTAYFRFFIFSLGLGGVFYITFSLANITLLNPFGLLLHYLLTNNMLTLSHFLIGITVHAIVPMLSIIGTHFFVLGFLKKDLL